MRLQANPALPQNPDTDYAKQLNRRLMDLFRASNQKVNDLADGRFGARDLVAAAVPTTGDYATGDFVANSAPVEAGSAGSKYVIYGWLNVAGGSPGTFVECRFLTGA
jgi:hypothetical protein